MVETREDTIDRDYGRLWLKYSLAYNAVQIHLLGTITDDSRFEVRTQELQPALKDCTVRPNALWLNTANHFLLHVNKHTLHNVKTIYCR